MKGLDISTISYYNIYMEHNYNPDSIIAVISRLREKSNSIITDKLKERGIIDIAPSHGSILACLYKENMLPINIIARKINRTKSTLTTLISSLETNGYIRKIPSNEDKRVFLIELTKKGVSIKKDFFEISRQVLQQLYSGFNDKEKEVLISSLARLLDNL